MKYQWIILLLLCLNSGLYSSPKKRFSNDFSTLEEILQSSSYTETILPSSFHHLFELIDYGIKTNQPRTYPISLLHVWTNLLKGVTYLDPECLEHFLTTIPHILRDYMIPHKMHKIVAHKGFLTFDLPRQFELATSTLLYQQVSSHYQEFKTDTERFLDNIGISIVELAEEKTEIENLQSSIVRFLEIGIGKLIWSLDDTATSWDSVKHIASLLIDLHTKHGMVQNLDHLDNLFWTLIHRFCYFLDLSSNIMPFNEYQRIKNDIATQELLLLELNEQATFIQSKATFLLHNVIKFEAVAKTSRVPRK